MRVQVLAQLADRPAPDGVPVREQRQVLALDGKTARGADIPTSTSTSTSGGYRQPHLVSVLDQASGAVAVKSTETVDLTGLAVVRVG